MNNQGERPIEELLRGIPQDHRICIPIQWAEGGMETGHHYIPVGRHAHQAADKILALREQLKDCSAAFDRQQEQLDRNAEQIAILRDALSRLVEVHDAMGGKCGTVRIAAEEALLGKAQSEYICTCGIRVTPHKCPTNDGF